MSRTELNLRLDPEVREHLEALAKAERRSMNAQVATLIEAAWDHQAQVRSQPDGDEGQDQPAR